MPPIEYSDKVTNGGTTAEGKFSAANANEIKIVVNTIEESFDTHAANTNNPHGVTKEQVGLGNADNTADADKPVSVAQSTAISTAKSEAITASNNYADGLVVGLFDDRGNFTPAGSYPSTGGSGVAGAIKKGDTYRISGLGAGVTNTLPTGQVVEDGDSVRALIDTPGNTQANWAITQGNIGFYPEKDIVLQSVQSTNFTAQVNKFYPVDTTLGNIAITMPSGAANGDRVGFKIVTQVATNVINGTLSGSDVINKSGGATTFVINILNEAIEFKYITGIWIVVKNSNSLTQLDNRYLHNLPAPILPNDAVNKNFAESLVFDFVKKAIIPITQRNYFANEMIAQSGTLETSATYRIKYFLNGTGSNIRMLFVNSYNGGIETDPPGSITVKARAVYSATNIPVYFQGKRSVVIEPGGFAWTDPIGLDLIYVDPTSFIFIDTFVDAGVTPADTTKMWPGTTYMYLGLVEGRTLSSDLTGVASAAPTTIGGTSILGYGPTLVLAETSRRASVGVTGNSRANGQSDYPVDGSNLYTKSDYGYFKRFFDENNIPYIRVSRPGETSANFTSLFGGKIRRSLFSMAGCTHVVDEGGINDVPSLTFSQMKANATTRWTALKNRGIKVIAQTMPPRVTTTNFCETVGGQTLIANEAVRTQMNDWVRTGADGLIHGYLELADLMETGRNTGYWKAAISKGVFTVTAQTGNTLTVAGAGWTTNQFGGHFIKMLSGSGFPQTGSNQWKLIASNTATVLSISSSFSPTVAIGDTFEVFEAYSTDGLHESPTANIIEKNYMNTRLSLFTV